MFSNLRKTGWFHPPPPVVFFFAYFLLIATILIGGEGQGVGRGIGKLLLADEGSVVSGWFICVKIKWQHCWGIRLGKPEFNGSACIVFPFQLSLLVLDFTTMVPCRLFPIFSVVRSHLSIPFASRDDITSLLAIWVKEKNNHTFRLLSMAYSNMRTVPYGLHSSKLVYIYWKVFPQFLTILHYS